VNQYHLEAQIQDDKNMALRIFEYGFQHALRNKADSKGLLTLAMPRSCVIYLTTGKKRTKEPAFRLVFPDGSDHTYKVKAFYLLDHEIKELEERKMVILLPFYILKLRKAAEKAGSHETLQEVSAEAAAVADEILKTAERSGESGILNTEEVHLLIELLNRLYTEVYGKYVEFKEGGMRLQDIIMTRSEEVAAETEARVKAEMKAEMEGRIREVARNMKKIGLSAGQIAQVSGFSVKEVEKL
ncbi:MAG: hypothetical protein LBR96_05555, partial [Treponema sp.]|nr:hypothetical protein [Treponema sp.]